MKETIIPLIFSVLLIQNGLTQNTSLLATSASVQSHSSTVQFKELMYFLQDDSSYSELEKQKMMTQLNAFCEELLTEKSQFKDEKKFLRFVFKTTQQHFLKKYEQYSTLSQTFLKGNFDCVSGSSLFALILNRLGFHFAIHETPFHVYLVVHFSEEDKILIESTNAVYGFIDNEFWIKRTEKEFTQLYQNQDDAVTKPFNHKISLTQLVGLQLYNQAVYYFNQQKFEIAVKILQKAIYYYPEDRIDALMQLSTSLKKN